MKCPVCNSIHVVNSLIVDHRRCLDCGYLGEGKEFVAAPITNYLKKVIEVQVQTVILVWLLTLGLGYTMAIVGCAVFGYNCP